MLRVLYATRQSPAPIQRHLVMLYSVKGAHVYSMAPRLAYFSQRPPWVRQSVWTHCRNSVYQASTWPSNRPRKQRLYHVRLASWMSTRLQPVDRRLLPCNKRLLSAFSPLSCQGASACRCSRRCLPLPASAIVTTALSAPDATSAA